MQHTKLLHERLQYCKPNGVAPHLNNCKSHNLNIETYVKAGYTVLLDEHLCRCDCTSPPSLHTHHVTYTVTICNTEKIAPSPLIMTA